jgi:inactivated superfamily I helicase
MPQKANAEPAAESRVERFKSFAALDGTGSRSVEAWFLGPRGENAELFERLIVEALRDQIYWRRNFHPEDPAHITEAIKRSPEYVEALARLDEGYQGAGAHELGNDAARHPRVLRSDAL